MEYLLTACALCLAFSAFFAWQALKHADDARDSVHSLMRTQAKLHAHDLVIETHRAALKRIDGKIGSMQGRGRVYDAEPRDGGFEVTPTPEFDLDPELAAELELQRAAPVAPGKGSH